MNRVRPKIDLSDATKVADGNDSVVYRLGDCVYKRYKELGLDETVRYSDLMNRGVQAIADLNYHASLKILGYTFEVHCIAFPVERVAMTLDGKPVAVQQFVPGPNLDKLTQPPQAFASYPLSEVADPRQREFFAALNAHFHTELPTRTRDEFEYHIAMLSRALDAPLGVTGVYIGKYNVKFSPDFQTQQIAFLITDIAVYIDRLVYGRQTAA